MKAREIKVFVQGGFTFNGYIAESEVDAFERDYKVRESIVEIHESIYSEEMFNDPDLITVVANDSIVAYKIYKKEFSFTK